MSVDNRIEKTAPPPEIPEAPPRVKERAESADKPVDYSKFFKNPETEMDARQPEAVDYSAFIKERPEKPPERMTPSPEKADEARAERGNPEVQYPEAPAEKPQLEQAIRDEGEKERPDYTALGLYEKEIQVRMAALEAEENRLGERMQGVWNELMRLQREGGDHKALLPEYEGLKARRMEMAAEKSRYNALDGAAKEARATACGKAEEIYREAGARAAPLLEVASARHESFLAAEGLKRPGGDALHGLIQGNSDLIADLARQRQELDYAISVVDRQRGEYANSRELHSGSQDQGLAELSKKRTELERHRGRIKTKIAELDTDNVLISRALEVEYTSVLDQKPETLRETVAIPEVAQGLDQTDTTDYFLDSVRAREVLTPFGQEEWSSMENVQRLDAIDRLAEYNAEILGITEKPKVRFETMSDQRCIGWYHEGRNEIVINQGFLDRPEVIADVVSHEYRHKYQHQRAQLGVTERDLEFRRNFQPGNYIRPEDNYRAYKMQPVEVDARNYAARVSEQVRQMTGG